MITRNIDFPEATIKFTLLSKRLDGKITNSSNKLGNVCKA